MSLIKCPECNKEISDTAVTCPHCGYLLKEIEGSALFKCPDNGGWNTAWIKRTVDLINVETNAIIKSFEMGGVAIVPIKKQFKIRIHVHGYMGKPEVTLYPGQSVYVNITLEAGGALGGGFCNAEVVKMNGTGVPAGQSSDKNPSVSGGGGCYIATCVYGSYDCPQVWVLRRYRDFQLNNTWFGRQFIKIYYRVSPTIVKIFGNKKWFKNIWRKKLDKMVKKYKKLGFDDAPYNDLY